MTSATSSFNSNVLFSIQMILAQYPILRDRISEAMFNKLVEDGYTSVSEFEERVRDFALMSQRREGLQNPFGQEGPNTWENRLSRVRAQLINVEYSQHYTLEVFSELVKDIVQNRADDKQPQFMWHNYQFSDIESIFDQALSIERLISSADRLHYEPQLMGAKVAIIRRMISDQLPYIEIAKTLFSIADLIEINKHRIGKGRIGGKAAGMILARRILQNAADDEIRRASTAKESYFIGADEFYSFLSINDKLDLFDFQYEPESEYWKKYPEIQKEFEKTSFPKEIIESLERVVREQQGKPFIVRSSSLLEDGFQFSLTGLYESQIVPNQGTIAEGLAALLNAIRKIYASAFDPRVLTYRLRNGQIDFPEGIAILIQVITGNKFGNFLFPDISGAGSSKSPFVWKGNNALKTRDEGYIRLACGMGTGVIRRNGDDFPQIVVLNEPSTSRSVFSVDEPEFAQKTIDLINLKSNQFETLEIPDVINEKYPLYPLFVQTVKDRKLQPVTRGMEPDRFVINFNELIKKSSFTKLMRDILATLEKTYRTPVMIEFTVLVDMTNTNNPGFQIQIDKCRPVNVADKMKKIYTFDEIPQEQKLMETDLYIQDGFEKNIHYICEIDAFAFERLSAEDKLKFKQAIFKLDKKMAAEKYILVSNDRLGTRVGDMGIPLGYSDISNVRAIVEISDSEKGKNSDPLVGTHFYQILMEAGIYAISLNLQRATNFIDQNFFQTQPNVIREWINLPENIAQAIKLLPVKGYQNAKELRIAFDQQSEKVTAYFI